MNDIIEMPVEQIMGSSFIDYAMSVIMARALPDVRDGCKPVHRRILHSMNETNNTVDRPYRKAARTVGDVMGKYHPHGDSSIYGAAVRMAQPFSMSQMLLDGQGNFGSIDGDMPAAMRYTEIRLSRLGGSMFDDIDKNTVSWSPNYDGSEREPDVLPTPFPNLLVNGGEGIAVGMASKIPPHSLRDVIAATLAIINDPTIDANAIADILQAPDFPTGAIVHDLAGYRQAVATGRGKLRIRSRWHAEDRARGASAIIVTELPFQVIKSDLVKNIASLVRDKKVDGIVDLRDESNKEGTRIWLALAAGVDPTAKFLELAALTDLEISFACNCTVLDGGRPVEIGFRDALARWVDFRQQVVLARFVHDHAKAAARLHILIAWLAALGRLDAVIAAIRAAATPADARTALVALLDIDNGQADAILALRLQRLTGMEIETIRDEHRTVTATVAALAAIIADPEQIRDVIRTELKAIDATHGAPRRTEIAGDAEPAAAVVSTVVAAAVVVVITAAGYLRRHRDADAANKFATPDDPVIFTAAASTVNTLLAINVLGHGYGVLVADVPEPTGSSRGRRLDDLVDGIHADFAGFVVLDGSAAAITTVTALGQIKRTEATEYAGASRRGGIQASGVADGDRIVAVLTTTNTDHVLAAADDGSAIRFAASDVRTTGRSSSGMRAIRLSNTARVATAFSAGSGRDLVLIAAKGAAKRTTPAEFPLQGRGGGGVVAFKSNGKTGNLIAVLGADEHDAIVIYHGTNDTTAIAAAAIPATARSASCIIIANVNNVTLALATRSIP